MKSSTFELGLIVRHKDKTFNQTLIVKPSMGPSSLVRKKGKYKLSELRKKIGKLTAEGTVKGERVAVKASLPQLPPSVHSSTWFASFFTLTPLFTLFPH